MLRKFTIAFASMLTCIAVLHAVRTIVGYEFSLVTSIILDEYDDFFRIFVFGKIDIALEIISAPLEKVPIRFRIEDVEQSAIMIFTFFLIPHELMEDEIDDDFGTVRRNLKSSLRHIAIRRTKHLVVRLGIICFWSVYCILLPPAISLGILSIPLLILVLVTFSASPTMDKNFGSDYVISNAIAIGCVFAIDRLLQSLQVQ
jgi:hypothetical protein